MTRDEFMTAVGPWQRFLERIGAPAATLLLILWMIWQAGKTAHETIAVPVITSHLQYLRASEANQERQAATLEVLAEGRIEQTQILRDISESQQEILSRIGRPSRQGAAE